MSNAAPKGLMPGAPPKVRALANKGNSGDNMIAHLTGGEAVIPREVLLANPQLAALIHNAFTKIGADPMKFVAGSPSQQINPKTGMPMFGFFSSIGHIFNNFVEPALVDAAGFAIGGPAGAAIAGGLNSAIKGGSLTQDALGAVGGYVGGGTALTGVDAIGNSAIDAFGGVGTLGAGQTIGSIASGIGDSISNGYNSLSSDVNSLTGGLIGTAADTGSTAVNAGSLTLPGGSDYNTIMSPNTAAAPAYGGTVSSVGAGDLGLNSTPSLLSSVGGSTGAGSTITDTSNDLSGLTNPNTMGGNGLLTPAGQASQSILNPAGASAGTSAVNTAVTGASKMADPTSLLGAAPSWVGPAASLASGGLQYLGTQNAISAEQQAQAKQQAIEAPYVSAGNAAEAQQTNLVENPAAQLSYIQNNPLYNSLATQATNTLEANQAAQGKVGSGGTAAALQDQLLQLGTGLVNNQVSNLNQITNTGANAAANTGTGAINTGNAGAGYQATAGTNLGAGVMGAGNAVTANYNNQISTALALARLNQGGVQNYNPNTIS